MREPKDHFQTTALTEQAEEAPSGANEFQETELGPLPAHWKVVRLGEVMYEVDKKSRCVSIKPEELYTTLVTRLYARGVAVKERIFGHKIAAEQMYVVREGDFIFSKINIRKGAFGIISSTLDGAIVSAEHPILRPFDTLCLEYLSFHLSLPETWERFKLEAKGFSGKERVKPREFLSVYIPLPPQEEQRAIARVLRAVQQARDATQQVIDAAQQLKKSLMQRLFTCGVNTPAFTEGIEQNPSARGEFQETELGPLPAHWKVVRLGEVVQKTRQVDPRKKPTESFRYIDVSSIDNQSLRIVGYLEFLGSDAPSRARKLIAEGDVLFATVRPYLKRIAKVLPELSGELCSTAFCVLRARSDVIDSDYLFYAVSTDEFVGRVSERQRGSSYPAVTDSDVLREPIPLPPLEEQRAIASVLKAVDAKIAAERARRDALDALLQTLLHDLMSGRRRAILTPEFTGDTGGERGRDSSLRSE